VVIEKLRVDPDRVSVGAELFSVDTEIFTIDPAAVGVLGNFFGRRKLWRTRASNGV